MKQLGLALHNYHDTHLVFPPAGLDYGLAMTGGTEPPGKTVKNMNGLVLLLPYLEQQPLFDKFDCRQRFSDCTYDGSYNVYSSCPPAGSAANGNAAAGDTVLAAFFCPSDPSDVRSGLGGAAYGTAVTGYPGVKTNYDFSVDLSDIYYFNDWKTVSPTSRYMFGENSDTRIAMVVDGTSNTVAFNETLHWVRNGQASGWSFRSYTMFGLDLERGINVWQTSATYPPLPGRLDTWDRPCGSLHPGGCNTTLGDGSVRFIAETTDLVVRQGISTMGGHEVVSMP